MKLQVRILRSRQKKLVMMTVGEMIDDLKSKDPDMLLYFAYVEEADGEIDEGYATIVGKLDGEEIYTEIARLPFIGEEDEDFYDDDDELEEV
jgi:hypothetical protein